MLLEIIVEFFIELFSRFIGTGIRRLGACIRWMSTGRNKPFTEVLKEDWNRRVGWLMIAILSLLAYFLIVKVFFPY